MHKRFQLIENVNSFSGIIRIIDDYYSKGYYLLGPVQIAITDSETVYLATMVKDKD